MGIAQKKHERFNCFITESKDLVTTHEQTRAGFLNIALEKNVISDPYVKNALTFKAMVANTEGPDDFLENVSIRPFLLTASGLSDKSMQYLDRKDQTAAIKELIEKFLKPAGENYIDEAIYRYLLIKGDAVGGIMRNRIGALGQEKFIRTILSCMNVQGIVYDWMSKENIWAHKSENDSGIERIIKAIYWNCDHGDRILAFNLTIPTVKKNVDICLFEGTTETYNRGKIVQNADRVIMLGELKGGIDPAGADEHWKTANTALERIRTGFANAGYTVQTSFVGAAIANAMADEIFKQLQTGAMTNAANLTNNNQLVEYCNWLLRI
ncbi:MAG: hypothetical protein NC341_05005 [Blautia sp.]|nr:hypothetical protein [Blautia sp.]MCM1199695.1 hypothetical protein [Bacteroides fragilis]